jgi:hypothetical protein
LPPLLGRGAWFGFGLSCSDCKIYPLRLEEIHAAEATLKALSEQGGDAKDVEELYVRLEHYRQEGSRWEFSENPRIFSVDEGGPADRAGLRRGDILTHIDGVALVSDEGGKKLGQVRPGDEVEFVYRRGTTVGTAGLVASTSPERRGVASNRALRRSQALLERTLREMERSDPAPERQAEIERLQSYLEEARAIQQGATIDAIRSQSMPLRYSGSIAQVNLTVRSHGSVVVTRDEASGEVVITTSDATIRVKPED